MVYLLGVKKILSHVHKTESWYLLGILFKISEKHPCPFYMGVPPEALLTTGGVKNSCLEVIA